MNRIITIFFAILMIFPSACNEKSDEQPEKEETNLTDARIRLYEKKTEQESSNYINYNNLAQLYLQKARETGDSSFYEKAESAVGKSLATTPDNYEGTVLASKVAISKHQFSRALEFAKKTVDLKPESSYTYAILGDAHLELGDVRKAKEAYAKMHEINPGLDSFSRISRVNYLLGDTESAVEMMENAYNSGLKSSTSKENIAWTQVMIGLYHFNQGEFDKAEKHYNNSMDILEDYYLGLEHLAELNAVRGNLETARQQYLKVIELNPAPEFYAALADVYEELGNTEKSEEYRKTAKSSLEKYVDEGDVGYYRALANFYADNDIELDKALDLAKKDLELRKEIYAYDTLAWMYYKNKNLDSAKLLIRKALEYGTKDAELYYHAGMIDFRLENYESARNYMNKVLEINPEFNGSEEVEINQIISMADSRDTE